MTLPNFGVELYLNYNLIDCEDYGNLQVNTGTYGPIKQGAPHQASVDLYSDVYDGGAYSIMQVVLTASDPDDFDALPDCFTFNDGSTAKMCIFQGKVQARQGTGPLLGPTNVVTLSALGDESFIFNRQVTIAANNNVGLKATIENVMADISETDDGSNGFPTATTLQMDQPVLDTSVGAALSTAAAPYGAWVTCQWLWDATDDPTNCVLWWRPSHYSTAAGGVTTTYQQLANHYHAWLLNWSDVGMAWSDNASTIRVKGQTSGGVDTSGSASSSAPLLYGRKVHQITGWVDSDADCATAASRLINRLGDPDYDTVYDVSVPVQWYADQNDANGLTTAQALGVAGTWASLLPGDIVQWNLDTVGVPWPTSNPNAASLASEFELLLGFNRYSTELSQITGTKWEWDNAAGWTVHHSLIPYG